MSNLSRQDFLKWMALGGASFLGLPAQRSLAQQPLRGLGLPWARLKFTCLAGSSTEDTDWNVHPNGDLNLLDALRDQASVNVIKKWNVADVQDLASMTAFPFIFMHADLPPALNDNARKNIGEYLRRGGFLFAEDCVNGKALKNAHGMVGLDLFFRTMMEEFPKILPDAKIERLPNDHPVFHCFYHLKNGLPHMQGVPWGLQGVILDGRVVALLSPSDNHCGWTNGDGWFGHDKQVQAMQMGTNIYVYAMTMAHA